MKKLVTPAFLMVVILLILAEIIARIFFAQDIDGRFAYGYDPQAGFYEARDGTVHLFRAGGRRFHRQIFLRHRPPGTYRVFVIGDSVPRGPSFKAAYPWQLEQDLRQHHLKAECINMALPGYGACRCQVVLKKALEFEPSLVIIHVNDTNKYEDEREWRRSQEFKGWHPSHWLMKVFIFRRLYEAKQEKLFWPLVPGKVRLKGAVMDPDAEIAASNDPAEVADRVRLAKEKLVENVAMVRRLHIPLLLISQCRLERDPGRPPYIVDHGLNAMCEALTGPGVYHLSMRDVFNRPGFAAYFADSAHLRPAGHQLLAQAICRTILSDRADFGLDGYKMAAAGQQSGSPVPAERTEPAGR